MSKDDLLYWLAKAIEEHANATDRLALAIFEVARQRNKWFFHDLITDEVNKRQEQKTAQDKGRPSGDERFYPSEDRASD